MKRFNLFRFVEKPPKDKRLDPKTDIGEGPIYAKGWLKWLSYNPSAVPDIRNFFVNEAFEEQQTRLNHTNGTEEDDFGPIEIPDKVHFFFVLTAEAIYVFTARRNDITKIQRTMTFSSIVPQVGGYWMGGVEDLGEFTEGNCFRVKSSSKASDEVWAICTDSFKQKEEWMVKIAVLSMRLKPPKPLPEDGGVQEGEFDLGTLAKGETQKLYPELGPDGKPMEVYLKKPDDSGPVDGKWVILQEWSSCTLACGGGTSTLHRQCIPPQNGGKPCDGSAVLTKECNTQVCEAVVVEKGEELPMKLKLQKISPRWQRYETCVLKEGDVEVVRTDFVELPKKPRTPARAILNNQTFSVYAGEEFESLIFTAPIEFIKGVTDYPQDAQGCFIVPDSRTWTKITLCAVSTDLNYTQSKIDWVKAINFFRDNCHKNFQQYKDPAKTELEMLIQMKKNALKKEEIDEVSMSGGGQEMDIKGFTNSLQKLQKMATQALSKEMKYEQLLFNEEKLREAEEKKRIAKLKEELKEKEDCIRRDVKKKELKSEVKHQKQTLNLNLEDLENTIKGIVMKKRKEAMKQVEIMKKMFEIRKKKDASEMQETRVKMAGEMMNEDKKGSPASCTPKATTDEIKSYCNKAYGDDFNMNLDCRNPENFCYFCCENEFGASMADERQACMDNCGKSEDEGKASGGWLYLPPSSKVKKEDPDKE